MSGDKEQEYFSEGLTEELLNSLSRINELQVAARTSSFSFQGEHPDIATVAHKLNVGAVLEGSVRRSAHTVRVTTQLINGITGFHVWSETYDRNLGDVLRLQTEIATAVASALKVTLLGDEAAKIEIGGTSIPTALDAYLRAMNAWWKAETEQETLAAIDGYTEAIHLDPQFALAYAQRSFARSDFFRAWAEGPAARDLLNEAAADAREAVSKAPNLAEAHLSLGSFYEAALEFKSASQEYQRALTLAPGKAQILLGYGLFAVNMGQSDAGLDAQRRSVTLDPLNAWYRVWLGQALLIARRHDEAIATLTDAKALAPNDVAANNQADAWLGLTQYAKGDYSSAKTTCDQIGASEDQLKYLCLAVSLNKLGRHADAEIMLGKFRTSAHNEGRRRTGESIIYAQWGDTARALDSLEAAMRSPDFWLESVRADGLFDPLRKEPRFQAIERALKFLD
jgi:TolB-like protein/Tfp pilus assembly protein PilF